MVRSKKELPYPPATSDGDWSDMHTKEAFERVLRLARRVRVSSDPKEAERNAKAITIVDAVREGRYGKGVKGRG